MSKVFSVFGWLVWIGSFILFETRFLCVSWSWNSLRSPGWPQTPKDPPASTSPVLRSQVCATPPC